MAYYVVYRLGDSGVAVNVYEQRRALGNNRGEIEAAHVLEIEVIKRWEKDSLDKIFETQRRFQEESPSPMPENSVRQRLDQILSSS